jgi:two-component system OmpR family response regulator
MSTPLKELRSGAADGTEGLARAAAGGWYAILVDRMLPGLDGLALIQQLRGLGVTTPALVLSALDQVADRITGLRASGDDYLVKPFALGELAARQPRRRRKHRP